MLIQRVYLRVSPKDIHITEQHTRIIHTIQLILPIPLLPMVQHCLIISLFMVRLLLLLEPISPLRVKVVQMQARMWAPML